MHRGNCAGTHASTFHSWKYFWVRGINMIPAVYGPRPAVRGRQAANQSAATRSHVANLKAAAKAKRDARMAVERKEAVKRKHESAAKFAKEVVGAKFEHKPRSWERVPCNRSTVMVAKYTRRGTMDGVPKLIPVHKHCRYKPKH